MNTQDRLKELVLQHGDEELFAERNRTQFLGLISDYFSEDRQTKRLLKRAVEDGIPAKLLKLKADEDDIFTVKVGIIRSKFIEDNCLQEEKGNEIVNSFVYVLNLIKSVSHTEVVTPVKYDGTDTFSEGLARVRLNWKYGFIDPTGKEVISLKYDEADSFSKGLARVCLNGKFGFIDLTGKEVISLKYDKADSFSDGLARVCLNGKCGFIDPTGKAVIPFKYDKADSFSEGLARVRLNWKYGFVDPTGKEVIPLKYDDADSFSEGQAWVMLNGERFYIDKAGNRIK
jgi:hypothetical protein